MTPDSTSALLPDAVIAPVGGAFGSVIAGACALLVAVLVLRSSWDVARLGPGGFLTELRGNRTFYVGVLLVLPVPVSVAWGASLAAASAYVVAIGGLVGLSKTGTGLKDKLARPEVDLHAGPDGVDVEVE